MVYHTIFIVISQTPTPKDVDNHPHQSDHHVSDAAPYGRQKIKIFYFSRSFYIYSESTIITIQQDRMIIIIKWNFN
ncbi:hypothetical protein C1H46_017872 [Malus baccata]|uniref:Uncharacterized protein n=1 Tax=Malus baccata TaxID=106549 RepID=A0A540MCW1_MALBA|nr:hypothetical protein C1H46_017872 [Malus baccata]